MFISVIRGGALSSPTSARSAFWPRKLSSALLWIGSGSCRLPSRMGHLRDAEPFSTGGYPSQIVQDGLSVVGSELGGRASSVRLGVMRDFDGQRGVC